MRNKFFELILNLEEMSFLRFLTWSSGGSPVQWSGSIYIILTEGILGNIHPKLFKFGPVVQEEMLFKENVYGRTTADHNSSSKAQVS